MALIILGYTYRRFEFNQFVGSFSKNKKTDSTAKGTPYSRIQKINLPKLKFDFSKRQQIQTTWNISSVDFRHIVYSWPFAAILLAGLVMVLFQTKSDEPSGWDCTINDHCYDAKNSNVHSDRND